ncbi:MAG TPA: histidine kinase dimerization/phosphoacceptor domain -containing protein [Ignavibacteriaceae bacterium]|nr:histidine kinase dimerization/phosphoacceptor domain -containing protein [Ignavibacteriaceae bacterium]
MYDIRIVRIGFIFILILIVGIGIVSYRNLDNVYTAAESRGNTYKILNNLEEIISVLSRAEESQRSFLITGEEHYLQPFINSESAISSDLNELKSLVSGNSIKNKSVDTLSTLINSRMRVLANTIELKKLGDDKGTINRYKMRVGSDIMNRVFSFVSQMKSVEYKALEGLDLAIISSVRETFFTIIIGTVFSFIIFLVVFYALVREIQERGKANEAISVEKDFSDRLINSSIDGIFAFNNNLQLTRWNPGMERMSGVPKSATNEKTLKEIMPSFFQDGEEKFFRNALEGNHVSARGKLMKDIQSGKEYYVEAQYSPILNKEGKVVGGLAVLRDSNQRRAALIKLEQTKDKLEEMVKERTKELSIANEELKKEVAQRKQAQEQINESLKEKIVLLREVHHRVKNNLQIVSSLLNLQAGYLNDKKILQVFKESQSRIRSMALIHEKLYQSRDLDKINFSDYIDSLIRDLFRTYRSQLNNIDIRCEAGQIFLEIDQAILCGLIINELISNSIKHAFKDRNQGNIIVRLSNEGEDYQIIVEDNGIGFPADIDIENSETLGLQLVTSLTAQMLGKLEINSNNGTIVKISFKNMVKGRKF